MGMLMGKALDENMKKQQDFMQLQGRLTMQRQIQMQNLMRERAMAMQIAKGRDLFHWWAAFYGVASMGMIAGFAKTKNRAALAPLLPLTFIVGYLGDMAYYTKLERIQVEADKILDDEAVLLTLPHGLPTFEEINARNSRT